MSTFDGLPVHILLVHAIVVLAPLTALLEIVCAVWRPARQRLVWLVLALAVSTMILTPITTDAGEWLERHIPSTEALRTHTELGDWMIYFAAGLLLVAVALTALHITESRSTGRRTITTVVVAIAAVVIGVGSTIGVYRIGESGAEAVWGDTEYTQQAPDE
ncbi:hypothetical protein QMK17_06200 [Rhodococcus sp. G-MC3]|uniref:DUF2231 domain-containing protein n=1 Tax=Rhodococcus sp. G-MC3 TaxID=3046209 RepID=UPI0024B8ED69|nr:DUF2231 domain-containing protein [Rhodococcus sp. G-MC3]MDJ0392921.1 hypothetical protein [Rhodococcus sp. G-MC3]